MQSISERFWSKVDKSGGQDACWPWMAFCQPKGYGRFGIQRSDGSWGRIQAHRLSYELTYGAIPDDLHVLHHCDNPPCCNPTHLFLGTNADNVADRVAKGREAGISRGEENGRAKLTADLVRLIRAATGSQRAISKRFGISKAHVERVRNGKSWAHV